MARLIEDLLSLSRIEQKQHLRPENVVDLAQTARSVVDALTPMARDLGLEIRLAAEQPVLVAGDRDELLRVAENLIENAIKYGVRMDGEAPARWIVVVSTTEKEGALTVRDYGHGIAPEHLPRLTSGSTGSTHPEPGQERHRPRPRDRQAHPHAPPGQADHHQPNQPGVLVRRHRALASDDEAVKRERRQVRLCVR